MKLKSSRLSYTAVEYFPFVIVICISKYDSVVGDSDVFLSLSSSGYTVEPPNKGQVGASPLVHYLGVVLYWGFICQKAFFVCCEI